MNDMASNAIESLRPSLQADGFDLRVESISADGRMTVILEALPDACMECLVPDAVLVGILEDAVSRSGLSAVRAVELRKEGFERH